MLAEKNFLPRATGRHIGDTTCGQTAFSQEKVNKEMKKGKTDSSNRKPGPTGKCWIVKEKSMLQILDPSDTGFESKFNDFNDPDGDLEGEVF